MRVVVLVALLCGILLAGCDTLGSQKVAVVPITGVITIDGVSGGFSDAGTSSTEVVRFLEQIDKDDSVGAVILEINSPGGSAVASAEIVTAIDRLEKPVLAWIREAGASGGYWIAASADHIIADRMSITGSVGVIASYLEFHDFLEDHNISYKRLAVGEHKDIGNPFSSLSGEQEQLLTEKLERIHEFFLDDVQSYRELTDAQREEIASGIFFLGVEAHELGLVDELGGRYEVQAWAESHVGETPAYERYEVKRSVFDDLLGVRYRFNPGLQIRS